MPKCSMSLSSLLILGFLASSQAIAMPDAAEFKKLSSGRTTSIANCSVGGIKPFLTLSITLKDGKPRVSLPRSYQRQSIPSGTARHRYAACGISDKDPSKTVLFLKAKADSTSAVERSLRLSEFRKLGTLGAACGTVNAWPAALIYKTIGSSHFHDVRRNTIGLIMKYGANVSRPGCIDIVAQDGTKVGDLGYYASGAGWYARYYGGVGCGDAINGRALAARAQAAADSNTVYMRIGTTCYGPIDASRCVGSKQC